MFKCKNVKVTKIHWLIRDANGEKTLLSEKLQEKCIREFKHGCSNVLNYHKKWQSARSVVISEDLVHKIMLMFKKTDIL